MCEVTNENRAEWGRETLERFPLADEYRHAGTGEIADGDIIIDVIADILHCAVRDFPDRSPADCCRMALGHFEAELEGGGS